MQGSAGDDLVTFYDISEGAVLKTFFVIINVCQTVKRKGVFFSRNVILACCGYCLNKRITSVTKIDPPQNRSRKCQNNINRNNYRENLH